MNGMPGRIWAPIVAGLLGAPVSAQAPDTVISIRVIALDSSMVPLPADSTLRVPAGTFVEWGSTRRQVPGGGAITLPNGASVVGVGALPAERFELKDDIRLYQQIGTAHGRAIVDVGGDGTIHPSLPLDLTISKSKYQELVALYRRLTGFDGDAELAGQLALDTMQVCIELFRGTARQMAASNCLSKRQSRDIVEAGLNLRPEPYEFDHTVWLLSSLTISRLFSAPGGVPDGSTVRIYLNMPSEGWPARRLDSTPFSTLVTAARGLENRITFWWQCSGEDLLHEHANCESGGATGSLNFIDVNEPLHIHVPTGFRLRKLVRTGTADDGDDEWGPVAHPEPLNTDEVIWDDAFSAGKRYRYEVLREFVRTDGKVEDRVVATKDFEADDFEWLLVVPSSELALGKKILFPLIVPLTDITNRPQLGAGVTIPFILINPRPRGASRTGLGRARIQFGGALAYLQPPSASDAGDSPPAANGAQGQQATAAATDPTGAELLGGLYASAFEIVQVGALWQLNNSPGRPFWFLGLRITELLPGR